MLITHEVVICSNRTPEDLIRILKNLELCENANQVLVSIVMNGSSAEKDSYLMLSDYFGESFCGFNLDFSEPGLVKARNFALDNSNSDLITFIDDDISVPVNFLKEIEKMFLEESGLVGCSPKIADQYKLQDKFKYSARLLNKFLKIKQGRVTKAGNNYWIIDSDSEFNMKVDWLPGCCMSYRKSRIVKLRFSTCLENGPTGGYALGEDVDFSLRASLLGPLRVNNSVRVIHLKHDGVRNHHKKMALATGAWNAYQVRNFRKQVKLSWVLFFIVVDIFKELIRILFVRRFALRHLQGALFRLFGLLHELLRPRLLRG